MPSLPTHDYHSQLHPPIEAEPVDRFELDGSVAFRHDLTDGLPTEYADCDVLYSDLPWQAGMDEFNSRSGAQTTYADFLRAVSVVVATSFVPVVLVTGRHAIKRLPTARQNIRLDLNGTPAVALVYGDERFPTANTATELLLNLADRFDRVGDFCCGYGRTLRLFQGSGKSWVGSDNNAKCIGYIAAHAPQWRR